MKASELRQKSSTELNQLIVDMSRERFNLLMQKSTGQLTKTDQLKKLKKNVARAHTILMEKRV